MTDPVDNDVSIDELREAVEHLHGVPARFVESVEVDERFKGEVVWQGAVNPFISLMNECFTMNHTFISLIHA